MRSPVQVALLLAQVALLLAQVALLLATVGLQTPWCSNSASPLQALLTRAHSTV